RGYAGEHDPLRTALDTISQFLELLAMSRKAPASSPVFDAAIAIVVLAVSLAIFALMVVITLAERLDRRRAGLAVAEPPRLLQAITTSLDELRTDPDAPRAIVPVYRRFQRALARAQAGRGPRETP